MPRRARLLVRLVVEAALLFGTARSALTIGVDDAHRHGRRSGLGNDRLVCDDELFVLVGFSGEAVRVGFLGTRVYRERHSVSQWIIFLRVGDI